MKLLHEVARLCAAGMRGRSDATGRGSHEFHVTVPASLTGVEPLPATADEPQPSARAEPPSFLKAPRHLRPVPAR